MKLLAKILLVLVSAFILINGLGLMFVPEKLSPGLMLTPEGIMGLSNLRSILAAGLIAVGIMPLIAAFTGNIVHARATAIFLIAVVLGRITGMAIDGYESSYCDPDRSSGYCVWHITCGTQNVG